MFLISRLFRVTVTSRKTEDLVVWLVLSLPATGLQMQVTLQTPWETLSIPLSAEEKAAGCINTNPSSVKHSHRNLTVTWEFLSWVCHVGPIQAALCSFVEPTREQWALQENNWAILEPDGKYFRNNFLQRFSTMIAAKLPNTVFNETKSGSKTHQMIKDCFNFWQACIIKLVWKNTDARSFFSL